MEGWILTKGTDEKKHFGSSVTDAQIIGRKYFGNQTARVSWADDERYAKIYTDKKYIPCNLSKSIKIEKIEAVKTYSIYFDDDDKEWSFYSNIVLANRKNTKTTEQAAIDSKILSLDKEIEISERKILECRSKQEELKNLKEKNSDQNNSQIPG